MKRLLAIQVLGLVMLSGCASYEKVRERHPYATRFVEGSLVLSGAGVLWSRGHRDDQGNQSFAPPICATKPEACR